MKESDISWLKDYFCVKNSGKDMSEVVKLFCDDKRKEELREYLSSQFNDFNPSENDVPERNLDHILYKIHYNINSSGLKNRDSRKSVFLRWTYRVAAILLLPLLIFWGMRGYRNYYDFNNSYAEIHSPAWTRTSFMLPDGTSGWLNSNSSLKYKVNFKNERHVELSGEAFFDVETDKKKPFTVDAGDISVMVHGTRFNVASWDDEDNIEVVLEEGEIEVTSKLSDSSFMMKPNEMVLYDRSGESFTKELVESHKYLSWTVGKLFFRNDPIEVVERRLERWYNIDVEVVGSVENEFRLRATFVDESLEEVLEILKKSLKIEYSIEQRGLSPDDTYGKKKVKIFINE
ncbi:MAG TPA: FecR family protein [Bacteroidales bacterium]|nr:FecR family protein [Bacteroidales bacterium]